MGSGWHEWPLMIFTVLGQCVAGGTFYRDGFGAARRHFNERPLNVNAYSGNDRAVGANGHRLYGLGAAPGLTAARVQLA
jgi:hypothetical protein